MSIVWFAKEGGVAYVVVCGIVLWNWVVEEKTHFEIGRSLKCKKKLVGTVYASMINNRNFVIFNLM